MVEYSFETVESISILFLGVYNIYQIIVADCILLPSEVLEGNFLRPFVKVFYWRSLLDTVLFLYKP